MATAKINLSTLDEMDCNLGGDYTWTVGSSKISGTIEFKGFLAALSRT